MSKRITITHADDIEPVSAIRAVRLVMEEGNIQPGEVITLTNNLAVDRSAKTRFPSFYVWRMR